MTKTGESSLTPWWGRSSVLLTIVVISTQLPFLLHWGVIGAEDFDQYSTFNQIALWWHALGDYSATWNPFLCGGATLVGNPQIPLFHPNLLTFALFGPVAGLSVSFLPWALLGFAGMHRLGRDLGLTGVVANAIAAAWVINGFFIGHLGNMHAQYTAFFLLPGFFLLNRRIAHGAHRPSLAVYPIALILTGIDNHHFLAYACPFLVGHFGLELMSSPGREGWSGKLVGFGAAWACALGTLAIFILPAYAWNAEFPRTQPAEFEHPLSLVQMLFSPLPIYPFERLHGMHERYFALGPVLFVLLVVGSRRALRRAELRPLLLVALAAFATAVGSLEAKGLPALAPFDGLRAVFGVYRSIRVPSRFFICAIPVLLLVAGLEWQRREVGWGSGRRRGILFAALLPSVLFNFGYLQFKLFHEARGEQRAMPARMSNDFAWAAPGHFKTMYSVLEPNRGILDCYEAIALVRSPRLDSDRGFVLDGSPGLAVERMGWGRFSVRHPSGEAQRLRFNFNHHRGWKVTGTDGEANVTSKDGDPLTVQTKGATWLTLTFLAPGWSLAVRVGLVASIATALFSGAVLLWPRHR